MTYDEQVVFWRCAWIALAERATPWLTDADVIERHAAQYPHEWEKSNSD